MPLRVFRPDVPTRGVATPDESSPVTEERAELVARFVASHSPEVVLHALSLRLAKQCRERVQHHLPDTEWRNSDEQFYRVIRAGFADLWAARTVPAANVAPRKP